jgi:hypothetical protein
MTFIPDSEIHEFSREKRLGIKIDLFQKMSHNLLYRHRLIQLKKKSHDLTSSSLSGKFIVMVAPCHFPDPIWRVGAVEFARLKGSLRDHQNP